MKWKGFLVGVLFFISPCRVWSGREGWEKKKGRGGGLARPEQKQCDILRIGEGKVTCWFWNFLGAPTYWSVLSFHKRLQLRAMLPVGHFEWWKIKVAEASPSLPLKKHHIIPVGGGMGVDVGIFCSLGYLQIFIALLLVPVPILKYFVGIVGIVSVLPTALLVRVVLLSPFYRYTEAYKG